MSRFAAFAARVCDCEQVRVGEDAIRTGTANPGQGDRVGKRNLGSKADEGERQCNKDRLQAHFDTLAVVQRPITWNGQRRLTLAEEVRIDHFLHG